MTPQTRGILFTALIATTLAAGVAARVATRPETPHPTHPGGESVDSVRSGSVRLGASVDRRSVLAGGDGIVRVELLLAGDPSPLAEAPAGTPTDLVVILDRSGSMRGEPLDLAKAAIFELLSQLRAEDRFGLVTYATGGEVAIALEDASDAGRSRWRQVVSSVDANGGTNMALGLDLAHGLLSEEQGAGRATRVILLSDGHANQGDHSPAGLRARAARAVTGEYVMSAVGVGQGFDESVMSTIADAGTGNFYYLPDLRQLAGVFADEFASARERIASALAVELRPGDGVAVLDASGLPLERTAQGVRFHPGDLFAGQERRLWLTLRAPTDRPGEIAPAQVSLHFIDARGERRELELGELPRIACVEEEKDFYASFAPDVYRRSRSSEAIGALKEKVARDMRSGRRDAAVDSVNGYLRQMETEQLGALGYVLEEDRESAQQLLDAVAAPSAARPEVQHHLGKKLLEEGRDQRRVGSKRR